MACGVTDALPSAADAAASDSLATISTHSLWLAVKQHGVGPLGENVVAWVSNQLANPTTMETGRGSDDARSSNNGSKHFEALSPPPISIGDYVQVAI